ncbi:MAG TPA: c-type cytochrome [Gemmatimonadaceae bacterium]|nr:c-type cytochrome [Gemmatimonadaceae bacterium]
MKRALRWLRNALLGLAALVIVAVVTVYALSERAIRRTYTEPATNITVPTDAASVAEGMRLAKIRGCAGCHGSQLEGRMLIDHPLMGRLVSPDLTIAAREYSNAELGRIIRRGVRPDGRSVVVMPSAMYSSLRDDDLGKIIAYIRSLPASEGQRRDVTLRLGGRVMFAAGKFKPTVVEVREAEAASASLPRPGEANSEGAYLARTVCTECHGTKLEGDQRGSPDLRIAAGYTLEQFTHLMRTGKALGGRELELMSSVARNRLRHFTDDEIQALHAYLLARAAVHQ